MGFLIFLGIIALLAWLSNSGRRNKPQDATFQQLEQRNQEWANFIAGYENVATTAKEKQLIKRMLRDIGTQGLAATNITADDTSPPDTTPYYPAPAPAHPATVAASTVTSPSASTVKFSEDVQLDNTSLLLYFGALLFVASVGLFIAFGGANGTLRALAVVLVAAVMYGFGIWLYKSRPKLQQAGQAFAGIGLVMAPLAGLAFYSYVFSQQHGPEVWLATSVLSLALYAHALITIRKPLISYLLIFSFLSLFESGISVATAPVYYFGWGLAFVGIILLLLNRWKGYWPELKSSSSQSAQLFVPISLITAIYMVPKQGAAQLGISLLLAAAFFGLEALETAGQNEEGSAIASQVMGVAGIATLAYGIGHNWQTTALTLLAVNAVQVCLLFSFKVEGTLQRNFASVLLLSAGAGILLSHHSNTLLVSTTALALIGIAVWWRQKRADGYAVAALALLAIPYIYGQLVAHPQLHANTQAMLGSAALLVLLAGYLTLKKRCQTILDWVGYTEMTYALGSALVLFGSAFGKPILTLYVALGIAASMVVLAERTRRFEWAEGAGLFLLVPIARSWYDLHLFLATVLIALAASIALALRYRRELLRWGSTALWLLLPVALGRGSVGPSWTSAEYAWAYVAAMYGLILSRAIARGVLFVSGKVPLTSYARTASLSYVVGYCTSAALAVGISLDSGSSRLHTTIILSLLMLTVWAVGETVEKRRDTLVLLPLLAQAALLSFARPGTTGTRLIEYLVSSTVLALVSYLLVLNTPEPVQGKPLPPALLVRQAALITAFVAPAAFLFTPHPVWPMPVGLFVAGAMLLHSFRHGKQQNREVAGGAITLSVMWLLHIEGVHAVQAYVHLVVATFAIYAYWRARRGEDTESDNYLMLTLVAATVPLGLQALSGQSGGLYGWWLLLEQIAIMLLGMVLRKKIMVRWGLYVALAAVLFQLRHLAWAALTLLALFLIGLAVYQLQKHEEPKK